ncbi:MAG TPA: orotate phosphoribosyltransferase, partial [Bacteroidales bacterium]|nr:orotate phosphoribosyltransferase [Bacteroidales bacterium]
MENLGQQIAEYLLQIKAIKLNPANPYTWASGIKSPIYCDNRKILSYPEIRTFVRDAFIDVITDKFPEIEIIAGVATGAIAEGVLVAEKMGLPFIYVRSSAKEHGLQNTIEGDFDTSKKVLVIEDLVSTGKSSLEAVKALREAGGTVLGMVAIFSYLLDEAKENFK